MDQRVVLFLTGTEVLLQLRSIERDSWPKRLRSWVGGTLESRQHVQTEIRVPLASLAGLTNALQTTFEQLKAARQAGKRITLEAQLGFSSSRVGILHLASTEHPTPTSDMQRTYVHGWVREMLHLDPASQVIRWRVMRDGRAILVSCVPAAVFEALCDASTKYGLHLVSCLPATSAALTVPRSEQPQTVLWTEGSLEREPPAQLFLVQKGAIVSTWRGWVPAIHHDRSDAELVGAAARFQARHGVPREAPVLRMHWPACAQPVGASQ